MKFSLINGQRQEAQPNRSGVCPVCDQEMVAKCGEVKIWHWAHKGRRTCDPWWENETEWHRTWKGCFPESWQEVVRQADNGEKHVADVMTDQGWVLEFQHSYIKPEERRSRDTFYRKLVWVVDGARRKRDSTQFLYTWNTGKPTAPNSQIRRVCSNECAILREWVGSHALVFFDFGSDRDLLWWVIKGKPDGSAYVAPFSRSNFIEIHRGGATQEARNFEAFVNDIGKLVSEYESPLGAPAPQQVELRSTQGLQQPLMRRYLPPRRRL